VRRRRRGRGAGAVVALVLLVLAAGAAVLLSNPRHRAFYLGLLTREAPAPGARDALDRPRFRLPAPPGFAEGPSAPAVAPTAAVAPGHRVPLADPAGFIRVPVADRVPFRLPAEGVPAGWELREFTGRAALELVRAEPGLALRLRSVHASFALYRDVIVDLREHPFLAWSWRVVRLPAGGDVRQRVTDDEAAQVYVIFPRWPSPLTASDVLGYVWDARAPVGTQLVSPAAGNVRVVVVASGRVGLDAWQRQERNVAADYLALFGRQAPRVGQVALMIDSDDTRGEAEALFGDLVFSRKPGERTETPTSMLR